MPDARVRLIRVDDGIARALERGSMLESHGVEIGDALPILRELMATKSAWDHQVGRGRDWGGWVVVDEGSQTVIGTCAFKSEPDANGWVEIAYFTFPPFEGRGFGSAMASALVEKARASKQVKGVLAHTLRDENSSVRILRNFGFSFAGEVNDPEDGAIWRWELPLDGASSPATSSS